MYCTAPILTPCSTFSFISLCMLCGLCPTSSAAVCVGRASGNSAHSFFEPQPKGFAVLLGHLDQRSWMPFGTVWKHTVQLCEKAYFVIHTEFEFLRIFFEYSILVCCVSRVLMRDIIMIHAPAFRLQFIKIGKQVRVCEFLNRTLLFLLHLAAKII